MNYSKYQKAAIWIGSVLAVCIFLLLFISLFFLERQHLEVKSWNVGWTILYHETEMQVEDISKTEFTSIRQGDVIVLKNTIPQDFHLNDTLSFRTHFCTLEVFVDGKQIYEYGSELNNREKMVGNGYHWVEIPFISIGKDIEIRMVATEKNAFSYFKGFEYGTLSDLHFSIQRQYLVINMIYIFLVILGIVVLLISVISLFLGFRYVRFIPISMFSFLIGMYGLSSLKTFEIWGISNYANTICEYESLYLAPIPAVLLFLTINKGNDKLARFIHWVVYSWISFDIVLNILHFTNILHFSRMLAVYHYYGFFCIMLGIMVVISNLRKHNIGSKLALSGFCVLCISCVVDMARFHVQQNLLGYQFFVSFSVIPIGALIFIMVLIYDMMVSIYHLELEETEKRLLKQMAFTDELCQIGNRAKYRETCNALMADTDEFCLIDFDLNGLKKINDQEGHMKGDLLIKEFATVLCETFDGFGESYRIGGDEFLVILPKEHISFVEEKLKKLTELEKQHSESIGIQISSSFGYAISSELEIRDINKIYTLADKRMYEMKEEFHRK